MKTWSLMVAAFAVTLVGYLFFVSPSKRAGKELEDTETTTAVNHFWTTPGIEPDTCVAAWLLTRIVEPGSKVEITTQSSDGVPFDMPRAELRRRPGLATSDVVVQTYRVTDAFALRIVGVIHELELMPWSMNSDPFFSQVRSGLAEAVNASEDDTVCLARALDFLDGLRASRGVDQGESP